MSDAYDGPFDDVSDESIDFLLDELSKKMGMPVDEAACDTADNKANAQFWHGESYGNFEELKAQCFFCQKKLSPTHAYDVSTGGYNIYLDCKDCGKKEVLKLTQTQINDVNKQGVWQAFLK